jgi:type IV secretory pathway VirB2 component (pilin)
MKHKLFFLFSSVLLVAAGTAHAATGGAGLPWETPLTQLSNSVSGPVAYSISIVGIVGAGGILIFSGGHCSEFLRAIFFIVLVISFVIAAKNTLTAFGFAAGATVQVERVEKGCYVAATNYPAPKWS